MGQGGEEQQVTPTIVLFSVSALAVVTDKIEPPTYNDTTTTTTNNDNNNDNGMPYGTITLIVMMIVMILTIMPYWIRMGQLLRPIRKLRVRGLRVSGH